MLCLTLLATSIYFYMRYNNIQSKLINIAHQEVTKKNPQFGYTFSSSLDGQIISHSPLDVLAKNNVEFFFDQSSKTKILEAISQVKKQKNLLVKHLLDRHGHPVQLYLTVQNDTILGLIFFSEELKKFGTTDERHCIILLSLCIMLLLCCLVVMAGIFFISRPRLWWYCVGVISCIMVGEIWHLWNLRNTVGFREDLQAIPVLSQEQALNFFQKLQHDAAQPYTTIPTGVFIENGQFSLQSTSDIYPGVFLNGYIWQRYDVKKHSSLDKGVIIANAHSCTMEKLYDEINLDEEIICWSFRCYLYQEYNTLLYPFDHRHVTVNFLHRNFEKNVALVPDFTAYDAIGTFRLPGISLKLLNFPHWSIVKTFFNFALYNFKTNLGYKSFEHNKVPYLQYIITMQRKLAGNFIMYFILFFVVLVILFVLLISFFRQESLIELVGFSTLGVLGACSALLFVLITSEINLRQTLVTEGIVYLEYLYFVCYFGIVGVIINSILFAKGKPNFVTYGDNLIFKLLYWPLMLLSIVLITAYVFY